MSLSKSFIFYFYILDKLIDSEYSHIKLLFFSKKKKIINRPDQLDHLPLT